MSVNKSYHCALVFVFLGGGGLVISLFVFFCCLICFDLLEILKISVLGYFMDDMLQRYFCKNCNKSYKHKRHLSSHLRYECGKEPSFECTLCKKKYFQKYTLNAHVRQTHGLDI